MYKLFNLLFGWDYILYRDSCRTCVYRVHLLPSGDLMIKCSYDVYTAVLNKDGTFKGTSGSWIALTWDMGKEINHA